MSPSTSARKSALSSTAEDYLQFAQMLLNGGVLNGKRLLGPNTVELMASNYVGERFNGKLGRPARGMGFGRLVAVVQDAVAAGLRLSNGSLGWDGAFGAQVWIDPKQKMVTLVMIQTQVSAVQRDFENAVMQALIDEGPRWRVVSESCVDEKRRCPRVAPEDSDTTCPCACPA